MTETREQQLEATLRRLTMVTKTIADALDLDPAECAVRVVVKGSDENERTLARVSLAECFAEAEALVGKVPFGGLVA